MHRISSPHDREITALQGCTKVETPNRFSAKAGQNPALPQNAKSVGYIRLAKPFAGRLFRVLVPTRSGGKTAFYGEPTVLM